jgi:hypothetical protein
MDGAALVHAQGRPWRIMLAERKSSAIMLKLSVG